MEQTTDQFFFSPTIFLGNRPCFDVQKVHLLRYIFGRWFLFVVHFHVIRHIIPSFLLNLRFFLRPTEYSNPEIWKRNKNSTIHALSRHSTSYQVLKCKQAFDFFPHTIFIQPFSGMTDLNMHLSWALMPSYFSHLQNIQTFFFSLSAYRAYVNKQLPTLIVHFWLNSFF